jgi:hypothetical protein
MAVKMMLQAIDDFVNQEFPAYKLSNDEWRMLDDFKRILEGCSVKDPLRQVN